jgi:hypothetical protein
VATLFKGMGGYYCRQCFDNPRYASQTKSTQGRLHFEAYTLRVRLGGVAVPGTTARHASQDLLTAAASGRAIGGRYLAPDQDRATDYSSLIYFCRRAWSRSASTYSLHFRLGPRELFHIASAARRA